MNNEEEILDFQQSEQLIVLLKKYFLAGWRQG